MRPALFARLLLVGLMAFVLQARPLPAAGNAAKGSKASGPGTGNPTWTVEGKWMKTQDDAVDSALEKGQAEVALYLKSQKRPLEWTPDLDYVRKHLLRDLPNEEQEKNGWHEIPIRVTGYDWKALEEEKDFKEEPGVMRRVRLSVWVTQTKMLDMQRQDNEYRKQQRQVVAHARQLMLGKVLLGLVALLAALVGYFRLEEATKGYYTGWLRLAALGFLAVICTALWLVP